MKLSFQISLCLKGLPTVLSAGVSFRAKRYPRGLSPPRREGSADGATLYERPTAFGWQARRGLRQRFTAWRLSRASLWENRRFLADARRAVPPGSVVKTTGNAMHCALLQSATNANPSGSTLQSKVRCGSTASSHTERSSVQSKALGESKILGRWRYCAVSALARRAMNLPLA